MLDSFPTIDEQELEPQVQALKQFIRDGSFANKAGNTYEISPDALIKLSDDEVTIEASEDRPRPIFDLMISPDPLTIRVANRLHGKLKTMGFDPVLIIGKYTMSAPPKHPLLADFSFQSQVFNQVVLTSLRNTVANPEQQFLIPDHLAQTAGISKVVADVDNVNDPDIVNYIGSKKTQVGIAHSFRLYNLVGKSLIEIFSKVSDDGLRTLWGNGLGHVKTTCFSSPYFDSVHSKNNGKSDNGQRRSLITNIHPSLHHHGVIPPFWQQYHMMKLMEKLGHDYKELTPQEVADICIRYGEENPDANDKVDPYLNGMVHHIEPRFDTGNRILIAQNKVPIDLNKPVWENYFAMEEMIVKSTLALAAAYKLGLNLTGQEQNPDETEYHSHPGIDSTPPSYMPSELRDQIKKNDRDVLDDFARMGGAICSKEHFEKIIFGDPETNTLGYCIPGTSVAKTIKDRIDGAYKDRRHMAHYGGGGGGFVTGGSPTTASIMPAGANDDDPDAFGHFFGAPGLHFP